MMEHAKDTGYKQSEKITAELFKKAQYGIEFYRGFRMAVDSLIEQGMNIKLSVFDTANDTAKVSKLLKDSALLEADLIIGPLYFDEFMKAADFAKKHQINIISPVKQSNKILLGNEYVSKVASSNPVLLNFTAKFIADSLRHENLIMIYPDHVKDRRNAELLKNTFVKELRLLKDTSRWQMPKEIIWDPKRFVEIKAALNPEKRNIIIVPSDERAFVTQLLTMMSRVDGYDISIVGMDSWVNFDNIDVDYLQLLDVHLVMSSFIDYEQEDVQLFERKFHKQFGQIPEQFSFLGYDVAWYYLNLLRQYGLNIDFAYEQYKCELLAHKFDFFKTGYESGYENHSVYVVRYRDYRMEQKY